MLYRCVMQDLCEKRQIFFLPLLKGLELAEISFLYRNLCHIPAECSHNESIHVIWLSSYMHYQRLCVPSAHNYCTGNVLYGRGSANKQLTFIIDYRQIYVINHIIEETPKRFDGWKHCICMWKRWWSFGYKRRVAIVKDWERRAAV